ncbi:MAG: hypothetical protein O2971_20030 [Proteobacteria bacterium]|nr:hypothetical protein [Pseudomonadota bacterium]
MKFGITKKLIAIVLIGLCSQLAMADPASARKTIAGILSTLNHFPSDAQKAELAAIAADESSGRGNVLIAGAVINMQHALNAEGKTAMEGIIAAEQAPAEAKALAKVALEFNHMASEEAKAVLAGL